jgi:hypothetical protein
MRINTIGIAYTATTTPHETPDDPRLMIMRTAILAAAAIALLQMGALAQSGKMYPVGLVS